MSLSRVSFRLVAIISIALCGAVDVAAQGSRRDLSEQPENQVVDPKLLEGLEFRSVGFSRGGRSTAVAGVAGQPLVYYFGATGGGVWKTVDAGHNWKNVTDGTLGVGSVGAIEVAPSDPNVVYVGTGSACPRGNTSVGDGMYRSLDAGKSWEHVGLRQAGQIGEIQVHPQNPDLVYVAALGHIFGPNEERGIYRSDDGGKTWERVFFIDERTGAVDIQLDPNNPRNIYAAMWRAERKPWSLLSGNEQSGIYRSKDAGDSWDKVEAGLPDGVVGRAAIAISPADSSRVWVLIEAEGDRGGLYRSDDGGDSFERINGDAKLRQRPWYYIHIFADTRDPNVIYGLNVRFFKSIDGGKSFDTQIQVQHGDNHDLWVSPDDPAVMISGNDGGASVSFDGGTTWSWQMNQPTAEIYRVFVDEQWPYRIYGSQQDNSTISVPSQGRVAWNRMPPDWYSVGGCESGHIAIDPRNTDVVYAGCYGGNISRVDVGKGEFRQILAYPQLQLGQAPRDLKYRFQWNAPIRLSPHDPDVLYHSSQVVLRSTDHGQSFEAISPDLTTNNQEQQDYAGGPINHDSTGVEVYNTVFAFEESPHTPGLLWAGSDDGRVHVSRDNGANWSEITPEDMPKGGTVNVIELSAHDAGRAFIAVYRYRENDFRPYIFRTNDYGASWDLLTNGRNGIPSTHFTRAIREDEDRKGLLYAGTEFGLYVSFDDGAHWQSLQGDLPVAPVTDLQVHRQDLVISTQGRAFWVLDDLSRLHQMSDEVTASKLWLYAPRAAYRGGFSGGAKISYQINELPEGELKLEILDATDEVIFSAKGEPGEGSEPELGFFARFFGAGEPPKIPAEEGLNSFDWNLISEAPKTPEGVTLWGRASGRPSVPGAYKVRLSSGEWSQTQDFEIKIKPDSSSTLADFEKQDELLRRIEAKVVDVFGGLSDIRAVKKQAKEVVARLEESGAPNEDVAEAAKQLAEKLSTIEEQLSQVKSKSRQDPINFPPQLDNQLVTLYGYVAFADFQPTAGAYERLDDLEPEVDRLLGELKQVVDTDVAAFNEMVAELRPAAVTLPKRE